MQREAVFFVNIVKHLALFDEPWFEAGCGLFDFSGQQPFECGALLGIRRRCHLFRCVIAVVEKVVELVKLALS